MIDIKQHSTWEWQLCLNAAQPHMVAEHGREVLSASNGGESLQQPGQSYKSTHLQMSPSLWSHL